MLACRPAAVFLHGVCGSMDGMVVRGEQEAHRGQWSQAMRWCRAAGRLGFHVAWVASWTQARQEGRHIAAAAPRLRSSFFARRLEPPHTIGESVRWAIPMPTPIEVQPPRPARRLVHSITTPKGGGGCGRCRYPSNARLSNHHPSITTTPGRCWIGYYHIPASNPTHSIRSSSLTPTSTDPTQPASTQTGRAEPNPIDFPWSAALVLSKPSSCPSRSPLRPAAG